MPKKKIEKIPLLFVGGCSAKYVDENGTHRVSPGDIVEFTPVLADFRRKEAVWVDPPEEKKAGGE